MLLYDSESWLSAMTFWVKVSYPLRRGNTLLTLLTCLFHKSKRYVYSLDLALVSIYAHVHTRIYTNTHNEILPTLNSTDYTYKQKLTLFFQLLTLVWEIGAVEDFERHLKKQNMALHIFAKLF